MKKGRNKKQKKESTLFMAIIYVLFSFAITLYFIIHFSPCLKGGALDLIFSNEELGKNLNEKVSIEVTGVLDNYAETNHFYLCLPIGKDQRFAVLTKDGTILTVKTNSSQLINGLEQSFYQTWAKNWGDTTKDPDVVLVEGIVGVDEKTINDYFKEDMEYMEFTSEYGFEICDYIIDCSVSWKDIVISLLFCLLIDVGCVLHLYSVICRKRKNVIKTS